MLRTAPSPFGGHTAPVAPTCPAPRPPAVQGGSAVASHLRRCGSNSGNALLSRQCSSNLASAKTLQMPRQRSSRCCAISETLDLVSSASAAVSSFDDVCEAFGDIAKLDNLVARGAAGSAAALLAPPGAPVAFDLSVALSWGVEKAVGGLGSLALLEGLVDKTLIDLFSQVFGALELGGSTFDTPWLRLGVAVATAVAVHTAVSRYQEANPTKLKRQLSPAKSLSDALADQAAAAVMKAAGLDKFNKKQQQKQQQQQQQPQQQQMERQLTLAMAGALPGASVAATGFPPTTSSSSGSGFKLGSMFSAFSAPAAAAAAASPAAAIRASSIGSASGSALGGRRMQSMIPKALGAGGALLLLGQVRRANKLKKQVAAVVREAAGGGALSPAALLVVIEAAALVHSYSEMANGLGTLLHLGA